MIIDFRYYIITIVTIFISLGLGILIGSSLGGNELVIDHQQQLINDLEHKLTQLREKNREFRQQVTRLENRLAQKIEFQKTTLPLIIKNRLKGKSLLLVSSDNIETRLQEQLKDLFQLAGAEKLKLKQGKFEPNQEIERVVFLGEVDSKLRQRYKKQGKKTVMVKPEEINSLSSLVEIVFKLNATDLKQVRSVDFEFESFSAYSGLQ